MHLAKRTVIELAAIVTMAAVVGVLAYLQFTWTSQIDRADRQQLRAGLDRGVREFSQEFAYDFERLCENFEVDPAESAASLESRVASGYTAWKMTTSNPEILAGLQIWKTGESSGPDLETFNPDNGTFEPSVWLPQQAPLRTYLQRQSEHLPEMTSSREALYFPWTFYADSTALVRPLFHVTSESETGAAVQPVGYLVVALSRDFLARTYFPQMIQHAFGDSGFEVGVRGGAASKMIYWSGSDSGGPTSTPVISVDLTRLAAEEARRRGRAPVQADAASSGWQLVANYPEGSLEAAVAAWRKRSLAISFGLLAILAGSTILIFFVGRRAERFAQLRAEFVASVSHELCTPVAVIKSAAENLTDGVVESPEQIHEYGEMIRDQSRRLERLVNEALSVSAGRSEPPKLDLRPIEIEPVLAEALQEADAMLREGNFTLRKEIAEDLPVVMADQTAVKKCVENLLGNAAKYAGKNRSVAIRALATPETNPTEVQISVADEGIGIPSADLRNIFEPFYRVQSVRNGPVRGVGLGLYLVKRMMEGMGGSVTAESELGKGSCFTLHFRAITAPEDGSGQPQLLGQRI